MTEVRVVPKGSTLQFFHDGSREGERIANHLTTLVRVSKSFGGQDALVTAAVVGHQAGQGRVLQKAKADALLDQAAIWDERSRDWGLDISIRQLNADRARKAKAEAEAILKDLGLAVRYSRSGKP
jgi:hypothetical protein